MEVNEVSRHVVDGAYRIHVALGPGLLESVYESALEFELVDRGLRVERQRPIPVVYRGIQLDQGFRADLIVEDSVIVEVKSVEAVMPIHKKILETYLKLAEKKAGLLLNFRVYLMKDGITRIVNQF